MTTKEFIELGNKLSSLYVDLMSNKNIDLWITFRNERDKGHLMDISLYTTDSKKQIRLYRVIFYQIDNLSEANDKFEELKKSIKIYAKGM